MITPLKSLILITPALFCTSPTRSPPPLPSRPSTAAAAWERRRPSPPDLLPWQRLGAPPPLPSRPSSAAAAWKRRHPSPPGLLPRRRPGSDVASPLPAFFRSGGLGAPPPLPSRPSSTATAGSDAGPPLQAFFRGSGQAAPPPIAARPSSAAATEQRLPHQHIGLLPRQQVGSAAVELLRACN